MDIKKLLQPKVLIIGGIAVIGGLFLASRFRPKSGGSDEPEQVVIARPISQPYGVDTDPDEYRAPSPVVVAPGGTGSGKTTTPTKPPAPPGAPPAPPAPPGAPPAPKRSPIPPMPEEPRLPLPGTPRRDTTPPNPGPPPITPNVPGNVPSDCRGVQPRPADHPGTSIAPLIRAKGGNTRARAIALEWVFLGIANSGNTGLSRFTLWIKNKAIWAHVNQTRRTRGLRAYTEAELNGVVQSLTAINNITGGRDDRLTDTQLQTLWQQWHVPYLCG